MRKGVYALFYWFSKQVSKKIIAIALLEVLLIGSVFFLTSCSKEESKEEEHCANITGRYAFTLMPDVSVTDTTLIKGMHGTDYPEYPATYDGVYLYEDKEGNIVGEYYTWKFSGVHKGDSVILDLYVHPDGDVDITRTIDEMVKYSTMKLKVNEFCQLEGTGYYYDYEDYPDVVNEKYKVFARKMQNETDFTQFSFCDLICSITSWAISTLTYNTIRPMGNCYLHKDGGGYYIYGHVGPGSIFPVYTQTVYFPWEWSWCKVRKYHFSIDIGDEAIGYEALVDFLDQFRSVYSAFYEKIGMPSYDYLINSIHDFYERYGGFAISLAYDTHTNNLSIYVNHTRGDSEEAKNEPFIQAMKDALDNLVGGVYVFAGQHIHDSWHLRRSEFGVCNSLLIIIYLFGTNEVIYN